MATIPMTSGFSLIPEGIHVFRIYKVDYDPDFGKVTVHLVNAQGITHRENYSLMRNGGEMNEGACNAFSYFAKTAMGDYTLESIDHTDLVGHYIKAEVKHTVSPSSKDPSKTVTFANLGEKWRADGFDTTPVQRALTLGTEQAQMATPAVSPSAPVTRGLDLDSLLN